jgi:1-acyl-sn-glycerol-3-phosphate acyltransferase
MNVPVPPRLIRRAFIDPLWIPLAAAFIVLFTLALAVAALLIPITPRRRALRLSALAITYLLLDVALMLGCLGLWLADPRPGRDDQRWRRRHASLLGWALSVLLAAAARFLGFRVELEASDQLRPTPPPNEDGERPTQLAQMPQAPLLVLARHAGPGDSFLLVHLLIATFDRCPKVVLKRALQWDPGLDVILTRLACYFLPSRSGAGDDRVAAVAELARGLVESDALLLFPEGGNWTPRRHRRAVAHLLRSGHRRRARAARELTHVLPPRPGGAVACLASRPDLDVLVVAHRGLGDLVNPMQMWRAIPLRERSMTIRPHRYRAAEVPREDAAALHWLDARWAEIDAWVAEPELT